jgi:hypothetical protein
MRGVIERLRHQVQLIQSDQTEEPVTQVLLVD